jgi:hypothetical protein
MEGMGMIFPTIHLNGTSQRQLLEDQCNMVHALSTALDTMSEFGPNGRDYYPQGDQAFTRARKEHEERMAAVRKVKFEIEKIAEYVADANGGL